MKERQTILETYRRIENSGEQAILATVVDVKGSSYRLPGAGMLIGENGRSVGTVSGGCLEADVLERAKRVLKTGAATVITYDTTGNDDSIFGLGMGCRGVIRVLLEPARGSALFEFWRECFERRRGGAVAVLIAKPENFPLALGARIFARSRECVKTTFSRADFQAEIRLQNVVSDTLEFLAENRSGAKVYETEKGALEFFIETVNPPVELLLFGAGCDALPVAEFAKGLGWRVSVIDHRAVWANAERFPNADEIIVSRAEGLDARLFQDENSVAVMMTHNYGQDREILRRLMKSAVKYIGALGPKKRTEKLLAEIGESFDGRQLSRLYAPVGLDIGAETPEEIALAVVAEIRGVLANRKSGFLRERNGIH